ncbi:Mrp/NBP35 family ATP-binding protein [bacterium]|nr:Mrp/NBP35 family ATP-binding protein [bacterium]
MSKGKGTDPELLARLDTVHFAGQDKSIVSLKMVTAAERTRKGVRVTLELPSPEHPETDALVADVRAALAKEAGGADAVDVTTTWRVREGDFKQPAIPGVKNVIAVASGKGGVGKSTVATNLAVALARLGASTGLLDLDFYGPSVPTMLGLCEQPGVAPGDDRVIPSEAHGVRFLSMGQFAPDDRAVLWRGPMLHRMVGQLGHANWGELDYLVLDLPPGTGDVQLTLTQSFPLSGSIVVTTPQKIALIDAQKGFVMFREARVPILGIVENMAWYDCGKCGKRHALFDTDGGKALAEHAQVPLLAQLPLLPEVGRAGDAGRPAALEKGSATAAAYRDLAIRVAAEVGRLAFARNPFKVLS